SNDEGEGRGRGNNSMSNDQGNIFTANDDTYNVAEDNDLNVPAISGVLANDKSDGELTVTGIVSTPENGSINIGEDGSFSYIPNENFYGSDTFTYSVANSNGDVSTATVTVNVSPVNDDPIANDDEFSTIRNSPGILDVLSNDLELDGDALSIVSVTQGSEGGTVEIQFEELRYTPARRFTGEETFTYTVTDGEGNYSTATVVVFVARR
nr:cadherin-like domain-containing protein [Candidatus Caenarcaniphilales bacterium]